MFGPVNRWLPAFALALLASLSIWFQRSEHPGMLDDTDTRVLLTKVRERGDPLSWFTGDWPLENHFYRPVSTLAFELDNALYGGWAPGYGRTQALIAMICVWLLFWFLRELTDRPSLAALGSSLFALWVTDDAVALVPWVRWLVWIAVMAALFRSLRERAEPRWFGVALVWGAWVQFGSELAGQYALHGRNVAWLPGRTATVMTVFALIALASYARYERLRQAAWQRENPAPFQPTDPPATRTTRLDRLPKRPALWLIPSVMGLLLALASYEQAVMVPACLLGVAIVFRWQGAKPRWPIQSIFWGGLALYVVLRMQWVPSEPSGYQQQQFRSSTNVALDLLETLLPSLRQVWPMAQSLDLGVEGFFFGGGMLALAALAANVLALIALGKRWPLAIGALALAWLAYLPMAWLKLFEHYHFWPMAMRSLYVIVLGWAAIEATISAGSPRALKAPPRPNPAPGSLPRP